MVKSSKIRASPQVTRHASTNFISENNCLIINIDLTSLQVFDRFSCIKIQFLVNLPEKNEKLELSLKDYNRRKQE